MQEEMKMELENQNLDSEFDIFATFKDEPKTSPDPPGKLNTYQLVLNIINQNFVSI